MILINNDRINRKLIEIKIKITIKNRMEGDIPFESDNIYEDVMKLLKQTPMGVTRTTVIRKQKIKKQTSSISSARNVETQIKKILETQVSLKDRILGLKVPIDQKAIIMKRYYLMQNLDETSTEYFKQKEWLECVLDIPWGKYIDVNITKNERLKYIKAIKSSLNEDTYGLSDAKEQILNFCAKRITNPKGKSPALALQGDAGIGKTRLIRSLSSTLNLPLRMISLGGCKDVNYFKGHGFTYEGAIAGRIVQILREVQCMNPIIMFDELDKIAESEFTAINGFLTHLIDYTSNSEFQDNYLSGLNIDLSQVFFIFSFNDITKVDAIVKDRMKVIHVKNPTIDEKIEIAKRHIIPEVLQDIGFETDDVIFTGDIVRYIIYKSTIEEKGVRQLYRNIETILLRLNVISICSSEIELTYNIEDMKLPLELTQDMVDKLFDEYHSDDSKKSDMMYT